MGALWSVRFLVCFPVRSHFASLQFTVYNSHWPFFDFMNVIMVNQYVSQVPCTKSPHCRSHFFCGITKPEENVIADITHYWRQEAILLGCDWNHTSVLILSFHRNHVLNAIITRINSLCSYVIGVMALWPGHLSSIINARVQCPLWY